MSVDHKPDDEKEKTRITKAEGKVAFGRINGNLNLSRCMGDFEYKNNKYLGKALGAVVKASTWVAAAGAGVLAADYVTDGIVDSFDSCAATGFFDGPDLSFLPGV